MPNEIIPKNIFQTHKSLEYLKTHHQILNAVKSWTRFSNGFKYSFYDNNMCDTFIKNNFGLKIIQAYFSLPLGVMKADLWRYCIIYKYGGIYADADTICKIHPNIFINDSYLTVAPEPGHNYFCQWVFSAPPESPILKTIIELSVDRILQLSKGDDINIHYLTGPAVFTDGITKYLNEKNLQTFDDVNKYQQYPSKVLSVFNRNNFHDKFIQHLFAGSNKDGWKSKSKNLKI